MMGGIPIIDTTVNGILMINMMNRLKKIIRKLPKKFGTMNNKLPNSLASELTLEVI